VDHLGRLHACRRPGRAEDEEDVDDRRSDRDAKEVRTEIRGCPFARECSRPSTRRTLPDATRPPDEPAVSRPYGFPARGPDRYQRFPASRTKAELARCAQGQEDAARLRLECGFHDVPSLRIPGVSAPVALQRRCRGEPRQVRVHIITSEWSCAAAPAAGRSPASLGPENPWLCDPALATGVPWDGAATGKRHRFRDSEGSPEGATGPHDPLVPNGAC